jgi:hypothetical protein
VDRLNFSGSEEILHGVFIQRDDMEPFVLAPEIPGPGVYGSNSHDYRYSRGACISETSISCHRPKSLIFSS